MDQATLVKCQELLQYNFKDISLLSLALTHASVASTRSQSNERLEFLGDAVLGLVVCHALYRQSGDLTEGEMTRVKSAAVSRRVCAEIADEQGISQLLFLGKGMATPTGLPQSVSAAVLESLIGAVYLDSGLQEAEKLILRLILKHIDEALADECHRNYKSLLQQFAQRRWGKTPKYQVLDEKGPDHSKCFEIAVTIDGRQFPSAWGKSKKEAEQMAAMRAMDELKLTVAATADETLDDTKE